MDIISALTSDTLQSGVDEFMRRHGWQALHQPKAIGYQKIPGDDTDEIPF